MPKKYPQEVEHWTVGPLTIKQTKAKVEISYYPVYTVMGNELMTEDTHALKRNILRTAHNFMSKHLLQLEVEIAKHG